MRTAGSISTGIIPAIAIASLTLVASGCYTTFDNPADSGTDSAADTGGDTGSDTGHDTTVDTGHDTTVDVSDVPTDMPIQACGGGLPFVCDVGWFCELPEGLCDSAMYQGICVAIPDGPCPEFYSPECGCDGFTYDNSCYRQQAGVSLAHDGECGTSTNCAPWLAECEPGWICDVPLDSCWLDGVMGTCTPIRTDCGYLWDPQCGCDGITYANECERQAVGAWLDHWGECGAACGDVSMPPCSTDSFCEWPTGSCGDWGPGECTVVPLGCPDLWDPVCGCDGNTYGNDCDRQSARVQLDHRGEC